MTNGQGLKGPSRMLFTGEGRVTWSMRIWPEPCCWGDSSRPSVAGDGPIHLRPSSLSTTASGKPSTRCEKALSTQHNVS
jgi:hypothetical protein